MQMMTRYQAEQQLHIDLANQLVKDNPLLRDGVFDHDSLANLFHTLMVLGPNFEFYYLDKNGKILTYSEQLGQIHSTHVPLGPIEQMTQSPDKLPLFGSDPKSPDKHKIFSASPVYKDQQLQGYLYVILGGERYDSIVAKLSHDRLFMQYTFIGVITLTLFLVLMVGLFAYLTRPMKKLTVAMEQVRDADYDLSKTQHQKMPWNRDSIDEVQKLGCAFNDMVDHIQSQFDVLQNLDSRRRQLLADLSHDLRTPLASLQGYIETLALRQEKLSPADREKFIQISLKNAQNLKQLIDQIFELAYIEAGQIKVNKEAFPVSELLYDIAAKFALKVSDKQLTLNVSCEREHGNVCADIGKLERVLTNLIDNAIRHTPERGQIQLKAEPKDGSIEISVADTGIGIAEEEVEFIFDTRYQASNSQKDRNLHAGLGLAICKKLIELMGSELEVQSRLNEGTAFYFDLPRKERLSNG